MEFVIIIVIATIIALLGIAGIIWYAIADMKRESETKHSTCTGECHSCPNAAKEGITISTCNKCNRTFGWEKKDILVKLNQELIIQCPHCQKMAHIFID